MLMHPAGHCCWVVGLVDNGECVVFCGGCVEGRAVAFGVCVIVTAAVVAGGWLVVSVVCFTVVVVAANDYVS